MVSLENFRKETEMSSLFLGADKLHFVSGSGPDVEIQLSHNGTDGLAINLHKLWHLLVTLLGNSTVYVRDRFDSRKLEEQFIIDGKILARSFLNRDGSCARVVVGRDEVIA